MITGVTVGQNTMVPAEYVTKNFKVTAELVYLIIEQKTASVTKNNATKVYCEQDP